MKLAAAKKYFVSAGAVVMVALVISPPVYADTYPYLKVFGGDVWAGGWFKDSVNGTCSTSSPYQDPANGPGVTQSNPGGTSGTAQDIGGILTYANDAGGGSSTEFGAFSLGQIDTTGPNAGFYSDSHTATSKSTKLSFATPGGSQDGGLFEGDVQQGHCIPDYYDSKQNSPTPL